MAFLCPARKQRKRSKAKIRGAKPLDAPLMGRITGSDSVDTLERVGIEKERIESTNRTRMYILHDFQPCVDDELKVKRGQEVSVLYQENDWLYVIAGDGREGFIPYTYCLPVQRSVDDFVPSNSKNQSPRLASKTISKHRPSSAHVNNSYGSPPEGTTKPSYQFATIGKPQKILNRSSSKSLPDISDLNTGSGTTQNGNHRYPVDNHVSNDNKTSRGHKSVQNGGFEDMKDLTYGMSRDFVDLKSKLRPRSLSYETQERRRNKYGVKTVGGNYSQPSTPVKNGSQNPHNTYNVGTGQLNSSRAIAAGNHGYNITPNAYSSVRVSRKDDEDLDYVASLRRKAQEEEMRRPLHQSWGPSSGQALQHLLQASRSQLNQSLHISNSSVRGQNQPTSTNLLQIKPRSASDGGATNTASAMSSFLTSTNRNRTPLSSSSLFREENTKMNNAYHASQPAEGALNRNPSPSTAGTSSGLNKPRIEKFNKRLHGEYLVLYKFVAQQENDLTVERGEFVTVLNTEDKDWYWVRRSDQKEGFVPSNYLLNIDGQIQNSPTTARPVSASIPSRYQPGVTSAPQYSTTARQQPQWSSPAPNHQPQKPSQPVTSSNYFPSTLLNNHNNQKPVAASNHNTSNSTNQEPVAFINRNISKVTTQQHDKLVSSTYHSPTMNRQHSLTTASTANQHTATATSSPRERNLTNFQPPQQQQISPVAGVPNNLSPSIPIGSTRLICLYEYRAQTEDDLNVSRGQWLYADASQDDPDWLWVYSPSQSKAGYIPRNYAKPPSSW